MSSEKDIRFLADAFAAVSLIFIIFSAIIFKDSIQNSIIILAAFAVVQFAVSRIKKIGIFARFTMMAVLADAGVFLLWKYGGHKEIIGAVFFLINTMLVFAVSARLITVQFIAVNLVFAMMMLFKGDGMDTGGIAVMAIMLDLQMILTYICVKSYEKGISYVQEKTEEAQRANSFKGIFLANVSHEIRTPMNAILGMSELVLREELSDTVRENTYSIQSSCMHLLAIVNDILDFSKIDAGKMEIIETEYEPMSLVNDIAATMYPKIGDKDIRILLDIDPTIPQTLIGDTVRLKQIILNLISNAVKFTECGFVTFKMSARKTEYGVNLRVSVKDTGIGIKQSDMDDLFVSFKSMDTHKKSGGGDGTGLGLVISKNLVECMNGFMNVKSQYNAGTEFYFTVPQKVANSTESIKVRESEKYSVLIYEPQVYLNSIIARIFEKLEIKCVAVEEEPEFLNEVECGGYTHIFMDYSEYNRHKEFLTGLDESVQIVCAHGRNEVVKLEGNVKFIGKPVYSLSVAAAFNNENYAGAVYSNTRANAPTFIAPEAKVLIVDDNEVNLKVAVGLLKPYKMQVDVAMSGKTAINMITANRYDLVCLDHMMPGLDGIETTKIIRAMGDEYYKKLPIIALTANAVSGAKEMFIEAGMNDFISKPVEVRKFISTIRKWLPKGYIQKASAEDLSYTENDVNDENKKNLSEMLSDSGISPDKGILYCGNIENYLEILGEYVALGEGKIKIIEETVENRDWQRYIIEVHALKSMSAQIGAEKFSEAARALETAGRNLDTDTIIAETPGLIKEYREILNVLEPFKTEMPPDEDIDKNDISIDELKTLTEGLISAVDSFDIEKAEAICLQLKNSECGGRAVDVKEIDRLLNDFEYDCVHKAAEELLASLEAAV
ncbi:MAG: response regulator [Oscillospiraceae bacterium]|nr:response regulator [Oscillospiraceae bacterium]